MSETTLTPELPVELTPATPAAVSTKNVLGTRQTIKLADWCRDNLALCEKEPNAKLAGIASAALEFTVTAANIGNALEALDIEKWKPEEEKPLDEQFMVLRGTVQEILTALALMGKRVERLEQAQNEMQQPLLGRRMIPLGIQPTPLTTSIPPVTVEAPPMPETCFTAGPPPGMDRPTVPGAGY